MRPKRVALVALAFFVGVSGSALGVEVWYDMEGDFGTVVTDKLTSDGTQNGTLISNVAVQSIPGTTGYGTRNARFGVVENQEPDPFNPPFSTIEVPDSTMLAARYTLAMWADCTSGDFTRLISSYGGQFAVSADRILLDFDPSGTALTGQGVRVFVNGVGTKAPEFPAAISEPGYHHYALTVDNGDVVVYVDGTPVITTNVGFGYNNAASNVHIGEDPHDLGGTANEQFAGNVDEFLAINQALSPVDIANLAAGTAVDSVVTPTGEYAVYYDFEGGVAADKFTSDGAQDGILHQNVTVVSQTASAKVGNGSALLAPATASSVLSEIDSGVSGVELGDAFTLSVHFNAHELGQTVGGVTRLFSNYSGSGSAAGRIILDVDQRPESPNARCIRFLLPDGTAVKTTDVIPLNEDHTITAVYEYGLANVYVDGALVASGADTGLGEYDDVTLRIGEDVGGILNEQFVGEMDDVVILSRALSATEVQTLASQGAAALFGVGGELQGDLNGDGIVGSADLDIVRGAWGQSVDPGCLSCGDPSGDGTVGSADLDIVRANWGRAAAAAVPEPHLIGLLAAGIALLLTQRKNK